jgi:dihydrofolate synthase/folylpolyglutamate synthase
VEWVLDVAHNVPAAQVLARNLATLPARRTIAVFGILGDKDIGGILATLATRIDAWVPVSLSGPRSVSAQSLAARLPQAASIVELATDVTAGCRAARDAAAPGDRIVVFGSFLTVGPALEFLGI